MVCHTLLLSITFCHSPYVPCSHSDGCCSVFAHNDMLQTCQTGGGGGLEKRKFKPETYE